MSVLRELTLEITRECMNCCMHCSSRAVPCYHATPDVTALVRTIEEASDLGVRSLAISGGEPFLSPSFRPIIKACANTHIDNLLIYTCGVARDQAGSPAPLDWSMLEAALDADAVLVFSVHSIEPTVHDKIVGAPGRLGITLESIRRAASIGIRVECHIVPSQQNVDSLARTARELIRMGVRRVSFLRLVPQGYAKSNIDALLCSAAAEVRMWAAFHELMADDNAEQCYRFGVPFGEQCGQTAHCHAGISKLIMRWDGVFFPCEAFKECGHAEFELGRLGESTLHQMAQSAAANEALRYLKAQARGIDSCPAQCLYMNRLSPRQQSVSVSQSCLPHPI